MHCVAFNATSMQHKGSAGSGCRTAIPDSQGLVLPLHTGAVMKLEVSASPTCRAPTAHFVPESVDLFAKDLIIPHG